MQFATKYKYTFNTNTTEERSFSFFGKEGFFPTVQLKSKPPT